MELVRTVLIYLSLVFSTFLFFVSMTGLMSGIERVLEETGQKKHKKRRKKQK